MNFCTYFDRNYLIRFLNLYYSLKKFEFNFTFYVLALDDDVKRFFKKSLHENIILLELESLEKKFPDLIIAKKNRNLIEYYFTLSPFLPLFIREQYSIANLSYLDSDFYFFKNPKDFILKNTFENSVVLIKQNSNPKYGFYNMGWIDYNFNFSETEEILSVWSQQCLEWCKDIAIDNKYADQKYLDNWVKYLKNIRILSPNNSCLSPWDDNRIIENNLDKMYAFHFHGFEIKKNKFITGFHRYNKRANKKIIENIYFPYLRDTKENLKKYNFEIGNIRNENKFNKLFFMLRGVHSNIKKTILRDVYSLN